MTNNKNKDQEPKNSSMVSNEEEMREHSKAMESVNSNKDVKKSGKVPDPVQYDEKEKDE